MTTQAYTIGSGHPVDQNLLGKGDLPLDDHRSGLVELVLAGTLEIGVGAVGLGVGLWAVLSTSAAQKPTCSYS